MMFAHALDLDNTQEFTVPPGHIFVMGDNRDDSLDSRVAMADGGVGFVPVENLVGKARKAASTEIKQKRLMTEQLPKPGTCWQ